MCQVEIAHTRFFSKNVHSWVQHVNLMQIRGLVGADILLILIAFALTGSPRNIQRHSVAYLKTFVDLVLSVLLCAFTNVL
jgi:hypothetical protein